MKKIVVLTGAGISAESGLKTFRDGGLWENHRVEDVASPEAWKKNPQLVLDFYNERRRNIAQAQPNAAHLGLAKLQDWMNVQIITQNIDDLHERAGSKNVLHLHGEIFKMRSERNRDLVYPVRGDMHLGDRAEDGTHLRPDIVWFGEPVLMMEQAVAMVEKTDIFVLVGSSLAVYPAAGLTQHLHPSVRRFVIDKRIPYMGDSSFVAIEKPATAGVAELLEILKISN